jgi:tRNA pseudouridine55 synthase
MDGLLVVDKPAGPTSHDVVARMRRLLKERAIGHTGTLDPMATGVLVLVLGRATRLAKFMSASDKGYEAAITLGISTDTYDADGDPVGPRNGGPLPGREAIERALDAFRGAFVQTPPAFSAKKINGVRSYKLARADRSGDSEERPAPAPVSVRTTAIELLSLQDELLTLRVDCSAGFYVRSLAHDLGVRLGTGAHLSALRRIRSGEFTLAGATSLDAVEHDPDEAAGFVIPMGGLLTGFPSVVLTSDGVLRASHGRDLGPSDFDQRAAVVHSHVRLLDAAGGLVGIAEPATAPGLLHPSIVLV